MKVIHTPDAAQATILPNRNLLEMFAVPDQSPPALHLPVAGSWAHWEACPLHVSFNRLFDAASR